MQWGSALELNREGDVASQRTQLKVTRARKCDVQMPDGINCQMVSMPDGINCHYLIKKLIDLSEEYTRFFKMLIILKLNIVW